MFIRKHEQHSGQKNINSMNKPEQHKVEFCWKHENTDCHGEKNIYSIKLLNIISNIQYQYLYRKHYL